MIGFSQNGRGRSIAATERSSNGSTTRNAGTASGATACCSRRDQYLCSQVSTDLRLGPRNPNSSARIAAIEFPGKSM